ncbi:MAG: hypothetical protein Q7J32_07730 [Sphingomonadaceae bacterium]|nr:hypothetical protein [Sphingomonadaceae bacterium]
MRKSVTTRLGFGAMLVALGQAVSAAPTLAPVPAPDVATAATDTAPAAAAEPSATPSPAAGAPVNEAEALQPKPEESKAVALGKQTFIALNEGGNVREIAGLLRDSVNSLGGICPNVTHYQVYRQTITVTTLKVACTNRPLYLLSVDTDGGMLADGGDGQVEPMDSEDGTITAAPLAEASSKTYVDPKAGAAAIGAKPAAAGGGVVSSGPAAAVGGGDTPLGWMRWLFALIAMLVAFIAYTIYRSFTRPAMVTAPRVQLDRRYSSEDKDTLVDESEEIGSSMWVHPSGLYIVRGRHGKRRIFPNWAFAQIYHVWGIKIRQIR